MFRVKNDEIDRCFEDEEEAYEFADIWGCSVYDDTDGEFIGGAYDIH